MSVPWYLMAKGKGGGYKTASGPIVSISDALAAPLRALTLAIDPVQEGTGDPSPDNVRPISGWTEANLWRTGRNLFDKNAGETGYYLNSTGAKISSANWSISYIPVKVGKRYSISGIVAGTTASYSWWMDADKNPISVIGLHIRPSYDGVTAPTGAKFIGISWVSNTENASYDGDTLQVEQSTAPTPYAPYTGNQYTIQLGQTVYGGTLDVLSGVLTVDREYITLSGDDWAEPGDADVLTTVDAVLNNRYREAESGSAARIIHGISNYYATDSTGRLDNVEIRSNGVSSNKLQLVNYKDYFNVSSFAEFQAILDATPLQLVYELATPITIPLTPQEISTLAGQNVLWADCGDVTVEYLASGGANPDLMKLAVAFMGR